MTRLPSPARPVIALLVIAGLAACGGAPDIESGLDADPWVVRTDAELEAALREARAEAGRAGRRVLVDFVAPWCEDCREVIRLSHLPPARGVIEDRYVLVYVNVGRFDRHEALLRAHEVDRIATLVVLSPDGDRLARTTLEPVTGDRDRGLTAEDLAAWLRAPSDG
ncbi:MAG: thioredoxin family protein [Sandaracinaceae bacterium]